MYTRKQRSQRNCFNIKSFIPNDDYTDLFHDLKSEVETYERRSLDISELVEIIGMLLNKLNMKYEECEHLTEMITSKTQRLVEMDSQTSGTNINTQDLVQNALNETVIEHNSGSSEATTNFNDNTITGNGDATTNDIFEENVLSGGHKYTSPNVVILVPDEQLTQDSHINKNETVKPTIPHGKNTVSHKKPALVSYNKTTASSSRKAVVSHAKTNQGNLFLIGDSIAASVKHMISTNCPQGINIVDYTRGGIGFEKADQSFHEEVSEEDMAVIILGTNDLFKTSWNKIKCALDSILKKLQKCQQVYIVQMLKRFDVPKINKHIINLNTRIKHVVKTKDNIKIINTKSIKYDHINRDGIHLNNDGKNKLTQKIMMIVFGQSQLNTNTTGSERPIKNKKYRDRGNFKVTNNQTNYQSGTGYTRKLTSTKQIGNSTKIQKSFNNRYAHQNNNNNNVRKDNNVIRQNQSGLSQYNETYPQTVSNHHPCPCMMHHQSCAMNQAFPPLQPAYYKPQQPQFGRYFPAETYSSTYATNIEPSQQGYGAPPTIYKVNAAPIQQEHGPAPDIDPHQLGYGQTPRGHISYRNALHPPISADTVPVHPVNPVSHFYNRERMLSIK